MCHIWYIRLVNTNHYSFCQVESTHAYFMKTRDVGKRFSLTKSLYLKRNWLPNLIIQIRLFHKVNIVVMINMCPWSSSFSNASKYYKKLFYNFTELNVPTKLCFQDMWIEYNSCWATQWPVIVRSLKVVKLVSQKKCYILICLKLNKPFYLII